MQYNYGGVQRPEKYETSSMLEGYLYTAAIICVSGLRANLDPEVVGNRGDKICGICWGVIEEEVGVDKGGNRIIFGGDQVGPWRCDSVEYSSGHFKEGNIE